MATSVATSMIASPWKVMAMVRPVVFPHLMAVMANCSLELVVGWVATGLFIEWVASLGKNFMCFLNVR